MIDIRTFTCNPLQENCFVVSDTTKEAIIIDCGALFNAERKAIVDYMKDNNLKLRHVLCTHAHFDHIFGLSTLYEEFGLKPRLHSADKVIYDSMDQQVRDFMGTSVHFNMPPLGEDLKDGELITFGSHQVTVLHTPGHSPGSVLLYIKDEKAVFAGDTLFRMSVGRTDLAGGSWPQLMESLHHVVSKLPDDVDVYTGHGPKTVIGDEKQYNPYLKNQL